MTQSTNNAAQAPSYPVADLARGAAPFDGFSGGSITPGISTSALAAEKPPLTREQARAAGLRTFFGVACAVGHTRRYVSNSGCVLCKSARDRGEPFPRPPAQQTGTSIEEARALGLCMYDGRPHTCGSSLRYVVNNKCVRCERVRRRVAKQKAKRSV